jgi:Ca2+-binding EF-hand superfamily protein
MLKVLEALYDLTGVPESERKDENSPKNRTESIIKKLDRNSNNVLEFDEFFDGCMEDELIRKILINPMFNC